MIIAGIDVGAENTKAIIFDGEKVIGRGQTRSGGIKRNDAATEALNKALEMAGIQTDAVEKIGVTGIGKYDVKNASKRTQEIVAYGKAAKFTNPEATMVAAFGANESMAAVLNDKGGAFEIAYNQQCSSGLGVFVRTMARRLGLSMEEINTLKIVDDKIAIPDGCIMFAELGVLEMLNDGKASADIAVEVIKSIAVRAATVLNDLILKNNDKSSKAVFCGGLAKNQAFLDALYQRYGEEYIVPEYPEYMGALGAALVVVD